MNVWVSVGMRSYLSGRADPRLAVEGRRRGKRQPLEQKSLDDVACSPLGGQIAGMVHGHGARMHLRAPEQREGTWSH